MARARNIKPSFFANDQLGELPPLARLLFIGLWGLADRNGEVEDRPRRIKAEVLPYDNCDVDVFLNLLAPEFIARYKVDGISCIQILNFSKHQKPHPKEGESDLPNMPENSKAVNGCELAGNKSGKDVPDNFKTLTSNLKVSMSPAESLLLNVESPLLNVDCCSPHNDRVDNTDEGEVILEISEPVDPAIDVEILLNKSLLMGTKAVNWAEKHWGRTISPREKRSFSDALDKYFKLGNNLNQRDVIAVRKTVSGLVKLLYPNGEFTSVDIEEILRYALVGRRRVKEQLKKIGGMEFYDVHFSYIVNETLNEEFVSVPEQGVGKIIPEGIGKPGHVYTVGHGDSGMIGVYKIETEVVSGSGKFERSGLGNGREAKENTLTAFNYFKANSKSISSSISTKTKDYLMYVQDIQGIGMTPDLTLTAFIAMCSGAMGKPSQSQLVVLGSMSLGGTINKVEELANTLQVCFDAGAKKILLPMASATDIAAVPPELFAKFQMAFYQSPEDAVFKALGVE